MFSAIKTSKANKAIVTELTQKLSLGTENVIARLAFSYSLSLSEKLLLNKIQDSGGKEYSLKVLFGAYTDFYTSLICVKYSLYKTDKDIAKFIKMHIDHGLEIIKNEVDDKNNILGTDFLINAIENGLSQT